MAQTGYTPILLYGSGTTGNTPSASNLTTNASGAELAINYTDGKLFYKDNTGTVQVLATKAGAAGTFSNVTITGGTINGTPIGGSSTSTGAFTTLSGTSVTASTQFIGPGTGLTGTAASLSIGGNAATATSAGNSTTTSQTNFSALTLSGSQVLAASNYNTYAPTLTGTGASGTWGISVTGNAATANSATTAGSATTATTSSEVATTNFSIKESGGKLYFYYHSTAIASMDSSGDIVGLANVTAYGTP